MRVGLLAVLVICGVLLAARGLFGPLELPVHVNSPMNLEGIFALAFLVLILSKGRVGGVSGGGSYSDKRCIAALAILVAAAFIGSLDFPLLADDYSHIWNARHADAAALWAHFTVPETDHFFRPVVYCSYALDALWAGLSPMPWRAVNLMFHVINTLLVFILCRAIGVGSTGAFAGALIFGIHGSRPEAVTWVGARFDLLAVTFGLACLLAVLKGARWWVSGGLLVLALMSKESAYMVPALIAVALWYRGSEIWKRIAPLVGIEVAAFAYRTWVLKGIGGYHDSANGAATVLQFGFASTLKAMLPRFWGAMIFPLNWTGGLGTATAVFLALAIAALASLAWQGADRRKVLLGIAMATICSLPVHQFLSIGPDLEKSRVLYFASVGLAVLFAAIFERMDQRLMACGLAVVGFQLFALESNLRHWRQVGDLAERTCATAARQAQGPIVVLDLPNVVDGVYFLHTGFPECVQFVKPDARVFTDFHPGLRTFVWDPKSRSLRESRK